MDWRADRRNPGSAASVPLKVAAESSWWLVRNCGYEGEEREGTGVVKRP